MSDKKHVLYIAFDGMTDPLGQSQVLSYLRKLSEQGYSFDVLSYEKPDRVAIHRKAVDDFIAGYDIRWHPLPYANRPPIVSSIRSILLGKTHLRAIIAKRRPDIVHTRSYMATILGVWVKKEFGAKLLFDMRGFWADERKDNGSWTGPLFTQVYKYFKRREKEFFSFADHVISLTTVGKDFIAKTGLKPLNKVQVIPTCVNFEVFPPFDVRIRAQSRLELELPADAIVMTYCGSLGGNYRTDLALKLFGCLLKKDPGAHFLFISHSDKSIADKAIAHSRLPASRFRFVSAPYTQVHRYLMAGDIGIFLFNPMFSTMGSSPTKFGEYLACGLKLISTSGIGDVDLFYEKYPDCVSLLHDMNKDEDYDRALAASLNSDPSKERLRDVAVESFGLEGGAEKYLSVYHSLLLPHG